MPFGRFTSGGSINSRHNKLNYTVHIQFENRNHSNGVSLNLPQFNGDNMQVEIFFLQIFKITDYGRDELATL